MANGKLLSRLRAALWVVGGMAAGYGAGFTIVLFILDSRQENLVNFLNKGGPLLIILPLVCIGGLIGFVGHRKSSLGIVPAPSTPPTHHVSHKEPSPEQVHPVKPQPKPSSGPVRPAQPRPKKTVFVSYRRDDSADVTGRIYDRLISRFGSAEVFKDVDSIPLGRDFREVIDDAVERASVVVVVIGKHWLGSESGADQPRIHDETDFVRAEVSTALRQGKPVIPVFVSNAKMPMDSELPDEIKDITYRNGVNVRPDPDFAHDVERLIRGIEQA